MKTQRTRKPPQARTLDRDGAALLEAVLAAPDDDEPRLVYADWLTEQGDPRGEFILVQIELARLGGDDATGPRAEELRAREAALFAKHKKGWQALAPGGRVELTIGDRRWVHGSPTKWEFCRGFARAVTMNAADLVANSELLFAREPVERVHLTNGDLEEVLARAAGLERLRELDLARFKLRGGAADALFGSDRFPSLRALDLSSSGINVATAQAMARATRAQFPSLRSLNLADNRVGDKVLAALGRAPLVSAVEELNLLRSAFGATGARAFVDGTRGARWRRLLVTAADLAGEAGRALAESPALDAIEELMLQFCRLEDDAVVALTRRPLPSLRALRLAYNPLTARAHEAVAAAPWRAQLTVLEIDRSIAGTIG